MRTQFVSETNGPDEEHHIVLLPDENMLDSAAKPQAATIGS